MNDGDDSMRPGETLAEWQYRTKPFSKAFIRWVDEVMPMKKRTPEGTVEERNYYWMTLVRISNDASLMSPSDMEQVAREALARFDRSEYECAHGHAGSVGCTWCH